MSNPPVNDVANEKILYENPNVGTYAANSYLNENYADVHFLVKSDDGTTERIPAHRFQMAIICKEFQAMLYGPIKEKEEIPLVDITASAFKEFLQFVYMDKVHLTMENFVMVMNYGHKYDVTQCLKVGLQFLKDFLNNDSICMVYELALRINYVEFICICDEWVILNTAALFKTEGFLSCSPEVLKHILNIHTFSCNEQDVFLACMAWTQYKSGEKKLTQELVKKYLGDAIYLIRFRSMELSGFLDIVPAWGDVLTGQQFTEILNTIQNKHFKPPKFEPLLRLFKIIPIDFPFPSIRDAIIKCNSELFSTTESYQAQKKNRRKKRNSQTSS